MHQQTNEPLNSQENTNGCLNKWQYKNNFKCVWSVAYDDDPYTRIQRKYIFNTNRELPPSELTIRNWIRKYVFPKHITDNETIEYITQENYFVLQRDSY